MFIVCDPQVDGLGKRPFCVSDLLVLDDAILDGHGLRDGFSFGRFGDRYALAVDPKLDEPIPGRKLPCGWDFYSLFLLLVCFSIIMALLPDLPCNSFIFDSKTIFLAGNTLNEKLPVIFAFTLLFAEAAFHFVNTSKYAVEKTTAKRFTRFLYYFFAIMFSAGMIGSLWMFVESILR